MLKRGERGQAIIMMVGVLTVIFAVAAAVVDVGLWLAERGSVQRAADFAALAGSQDLPLDDGLAEASALDWAARNGYPDGVNGVDVTVELLCKNTFPDPPAGICTNTNPAGGPSACLAGSGCDGLRVIISKPAGRLFTSIFGVGEVHVASGAAAGLDIYSQPVDAMVLLDATGSMGRTCNVLAPPEGCPPENVVCDPEDDNDGCPIKEARDGANAFIDILLARGGPTQVGFAPYRGCYNPPRLFDACAPAVNVVSLSDDADVLHAGVSQTTSVGGTGTNDCLAVLKALEVLNGAGAAQSEDARRFMIILSDGDHTYNANAVGDAQPPAACAASEPLSDPRDPYIGDFCMPEPAHPSEAELDGRTLVMANELKTQGVSIYVVGLGVCGDDDGRTASDAGYCDGVGDAAHDYAANQRLLKCLASSPSQYYRVTSAQQLGDIFQLIAWEIVGRGLIQ